MEPSRVSVLKGVPIVAVCGGPSAAHCAAIAEDGRAYGCGADGRGGAATSATPCDLSACQPAAVRPRSPDRGLRRARPTPRRVARWDGEPADPHGRG